ncbi:Serine protease 42 [Cyphomyrmex costatus]|uniref:Serine protease 42 n=1 Tax=Cyphomyrmex costatus TaxID=456900 RepID=A0A151IM33_9HYME|nr:Serine protease 42 [Cyphomyrmex costatus]
MTFENYSFAGVYGDEPDKLVNGIPTSIQEYPHCVSLRNNNNHLCGGSIIDSRYILTAGHCVASLLYDRSRLQSTFVVTDTTYLIKPIQFGTGQRAIKLPTQDISANDIVTIAAWGSTGYQRPL